MKFKNVFLKKLFNPKNVPLVLWLMPLCMALSLLVFSGQARANPLGVRLETALDLSLIHICHEHG